MLNSRLLNFIEGKKRFFSSYTVFRCVLLKKETFNATIFDKYGGKKLVVIKKNHSFERMQIQSRIRERIFGTFLLNAFH